MQHIPTLTLLVGLVAIAGSGLAADDPNGTAPTKPETTRVLIMTLPRVPDCTNCFPQRMIPTSVTGEYVNLDALSKHPDRKLWVENGYAIVMIGDKFGFCDAKGKVSIQPQFDEAKSFSEARAVVRVAGKYGYIDTKGQMIVKPRFDFAFPFEHGLGAVQVRKKWGVVNLQGDWIKEPTYKRLDPLVGGILAVTFDGKQGFINEHGEI